MDAQRVGRYGRAIRAVSFSSGTKAVRPVGLRRTVDNNSSWKAPTSGRLSGPTVDRFVASDWEFASADAGFNLHPYPARFVLPLPLLALDILRPTIGVLDPFCGSGTTLEAATMTRLRSTGIDLNPIACLLSRVRVSGWRAPEDDDLAAHHMHALVDAAKNVSDDVVENMRNAIPRVDHWFEPWAQRLLAGATDYLRRIDCADCWHDRLAVSISSTVVRLSRQDSDTRYAAVSKNIDEREGVASLRSAVDRTASYLRVRSCDNRPEAIVYQRDARDLRPIADNSHDAAIFSPPYPNAYEYWLYHKYRMYWLQHDPIAVREAEIGARPHFFRSKNPQTEQDFAQQMGEVFAGLGRVLRASSPTVVVVGDSVIRGRVINNRELLFDVARDQGFIPRAATLRTISRARSSFNHAHGQGRNAEHILLLESPR